MWATATQSATTSPLAAWARRMLLTMPNVRSETVVLGLNPAPGGATAPSRTSPLTVERSHNAVALPLGATSTRTQHTSPVASDSGTAGIHPAPGSRTAAWIPGVLYEDQTATVRPVGLVATSGLRALSAGVERSVCPDQARPGPLRVLDRTTYFVPSWWAHTAVAAPEVVTATLGGGADSGWGAKGSTAPHPPRGAVVDDRAKRVGPSR